jgi:hypothetical protein
MSALPFDEFLVKFRALFPVFDSVSDATIEMYYEQMLAIFCICDYASLYLTAFLLEDDQTRGTGTKDGITDGGSGEHIAEKVGDVDVTLKSGTPNAKDVYFSTNPYGRRFLALRDACPGWVFSARVFPGSVPGMYY